MTNQNLWKTCKHNGRFILQSSWNIDRPPYIFVCEFQCGFWLNFNPDYAGRIKTHHEENGVRVDDWWAHILAFTKENQGDKDLPLLTPSRS